MNREDVIREIVERDVQNLALSEQFVQRDAAALYNAACEHFGTWDTALKYAGVSLRRVAIEDEFSRERTMQKIRYLCYSGYDLSANHNARRDWRLHAAACQHFGSWRAALRAIGVNLNHIRPRKARLHDRAEIIEELRALHEAGFEMTWGRVCLENRGLAIAAKTAFHNWRRALTAAGLAPEECVTKGGPKWDRQPVIEALKARHREGRRMTATATRQDDAALAGAVRRCFLTWSDAIQAAGWKPEKRRPKGTGK